MSNKRLLQKRGVKVTDARLEILDFLSKSSHPVSYENIKDSLSMDKATFYRNITKFEELDIINSIESHDKKRYFEIKKKPHAHFTCRLCNRVECIESGIYISLPKYDIENVIVQGVCPTCKLTDCLP